MTQLYIQGVTKVTHAEIEELMFFYTERVNPETEEV